MKNKLLSLTFLLLVFSVSTLANENKIIERIKEGNKNAKITIITYESLTCSHCADFHNQVYPKLKKNFIDTGLVKIEFRHFPLDMAAFNASKISQCNNDGNSKIMHILFLKQNDWVNGKTVDEANNNLKKLLNKEGIKLDFDKCIEDTNIENYVLNDRIEGVKQFEVNATPTIIINNKKFNKPLNYKNLKKFLEKLI